MQEQITVMVELTFDMQAEFTAAAQQGQIHERLRDFLLEDSEAVEFKVKRFEPEFDTYSNPTRDAAGRAIRIGDQVFWNRCIAEVRTITEKRIGIAAGGHRLSVIQPEHCVVVI